MKRNKLRKAIKLAVVYKMSPVKFAELAKVSVEMAKKLFEDAKDEKS